jgi:multidrug efflux pump subunit AcrB
VIGGGSIAVSEVASFETGRSIDAIRRYKGFRTISIAASVDRLVTTPIAATKAVRSRLANFSERFPGYKIDYSGEFEEFSKSLQSLLYLSVFGMLLVYLILGAQFRSFTQPLIIIGFTFPGALLGSALALLITGNPLTLATLYGVVALLGIVVNDSLVFISFMNAARERGATVVDAVYEAGRVRLRPIVLTTITTVFGLLPMALGLGGKSDAWGPMATTIVCGLIVATATTLFVIPPVYLCVRDLEKLGAAVRDELKRPTC